MNLRKVFFLSGLGILLFGAQATVEASETVGKTESGISITLLERDLAINKVETPSFGRQLCNGKDQVFTSQRDLVVRVKDNREARSPWKLSYRYQGGTVSDKVARDVIYRIAEGALSVIEEVDKNEVATPLAKKNYVASVVEVDHKQREAVEQDLLQLQEVAEDSGTLYEYRVAKEDISMEVPKELTKGVYHGTQTVCLYNVPI
ncbi:hypothetical protein P7G51_09190 [Enterococcus asini]|uniref:hypothetical protein n=1 Tax=Enterococcus asini TaxID=57732 RepID=UPI0028901A47|nr:hypothetical protein [Enterococcus asini]MDT2757550.1 hypothetical protein [Enterococcus asini]